MEIKHWKLASLFMNYKNVQKALVPLIELTEFPLYRLELQQNIWRKRNELELNSGLSTNTILRMLIIWSK